MQDTVERGVCALEQAKKGRWEVCLTVRVRVNYPEGGGEGGGPSGGFVREGDE